MRIFQKPANTAIGIDIGTFSTKAVQLGKSTHGTSLDAYTKINTNNLDLESYKYLQRLAESIFANTIYGNFDSKTLVLSMPRKMVFETIVTIEKNNLKAPKKEIEYQLRNLYNLNTDLLYINFTLINESQIASSKTTQSYAVVCIVKDLAELIIKVFRDIGFRKVIITSDLAAFDTSLIKKQKPTAIVDLGHQSSSYIFSDGKRFLSTKLNFASEKLNSLVSNKLNLDNIATNKVIYNVGLDESQQGSEIRSACKDYLLELTNELNQNIKNTNIFADEVNAKLQNVIVAGQIANIPGLLEFMTQKTRLNLQPANPWAKTSIYPLKPMPKNRNTQYVNAVGLALSEA